MLLSSLEKVCFQDLLSGNSRSSNFGFQKQDRSVRILSVSSLKWSAAYQLEEAIAMLKEVHFIKFDETVEIAVRLGVDPKHVDQMVHGTVVLAPRHRTRGAHLGLRQR